MVNKTRISQLQRLVETYLPNRSDYIRADSNYNETELRNDFLDPFLEILGWDVRNQQGAPQHLREVVHEDSVDVEEEAAQKKPDYALRVGMKRKIFIEAKSPSVPITYHQGAAFQLRRYGWNGGLAVSVLTNFDKLIIYDTRYRHEPQGNEYIEYLQSNKRDILYRRMLPIATRNEYRPP